MQHGKRYRSVAEKVGERFYSLEEAVALVKETASAKFEETIELSMKLNLKRSVNVRSIMVLPHQFGAERRILVFSKGEKAQEAEKAGATFVGDVDLIEKIKGGWLDFDVAVATPDMMREVGKLGPILGRRGLMPNPKTNTVTMDIKAALNELRQGRIEFRSDKTGVVHLAIGKASMDVQQLVENVRYAIGEIRDQKPSDTKGELVSSVALSATMGPGVRVATEEVQ